MPDEENKPGFMDNLKSVLYGMAGHDMARYALKTRGSMEHLFAVLQPAPAALRGAADQHLEAPHAA
jgi:hypothetical protein